MELRQWNLEGLEKRGCENLGDVQARDQRRKPAADQQPKRSAAEDYDFIFGGSNDS